MAVSVVTLSTYGYPKGSTNDQRNQTVRGTVSFSIGTYPVGGFPLNWGLLEGVKAIPAGSTTPSSTGTILPTDCDIKSVSNPPSGVIYTWDNVLGNLHIFLVGPGAACSISGPLVEFYPGANIPGWILNDTVMFRAVFPRE
jgi:hypothetical protein